MVLSPDGLQNDCSNEGRIEKRKVAHSIHHKTLHELPSMIEEKKLSKSETLLCLKPYYCVPLVVGELYRDQKSRKQRERQHHLAVFQ